MLGHKIDFLFGIALIKLSPAEYILSIFRYFSVALMQPFRTRTPTAVPTMILARVRENDISRVSSLTLVLFKSIKGWENSAVAPRISLCSGDERLLLAYLHQRENAEPETSRYGSLHIRRSKRGPLYATAPKDGLLLMLIDMFHTSYLYPYNLTLSM